MKDPEAVVIGAGPAGSVAAFLLARAGVRTLLVDRERFPRRKLCGGCLASRGVDVLRDLGLGDLASLGGTGRIRRIEMRSAGRRLELEIPAYLVIDRAAFDAELARASVSAGAAFEDGTRAAVQLDGSVELRSESGACRTLRPRVVLVADGLKGSSLREHGAFGWRVARNPRVGLGGVAASMPEGCSRGAVTMLCGRAGYAGLAPMADGRAVIAAAADPGWLASNTNGPPLRSLLGGLGLTDGDELEIDLSPGAPALRRRRSAFEEGGRVFVLGDAGGYLEPFTGEGMTWAIESAAAAVPHALLAVEGEYVPGSWSACRERWRVRRGLLCRASASLLRHPWALGLTMALCDARPGVSRAVSETVRRLQRRVDVRGGVA